MRDLIEPRALRAMREQEERMRDLIEPRALRAMREQEARMRDLIEPRALRAMREQEERMRDLVEPRALRAMREQEERMRDLIDPSALRALRESTGYGRISEAIIDTMAAIQPRLVEAELAMSKMTDAGAVIRAMHERTSATFSQLLPLASRDYSGVAAAFDSYLSAAPIDQGTSFTALPGREFFVSADLLSRLAGRGLSRDQVDDDPQLVRDDIDLYVYNTLDETLTDFAPQLLSSLQGARQIAVSKNPEKVRYACVSLRTVSLGVLELLAPTDQIRRWSLRSRDFFNGRPRTRTRLRFIAQQIGSPSLSRFMEADSQAICELLDVLHAGTHEVDLGMNLRQLRYLFRRVESFLCAIVEASLTG